MIFTCALCGNEFDEEPDEKTLVQAALDLQSGMIKPGEETAFVCDACHVLLTLDFKQHGS